MDGSDNVNNTRKRSNGYGRNIERDKRMKGEAYIGYRRKNKKNTNIIIQDVPKGERIMGPRCSSAACKKFVTRSCDEVSEEMRANIFEAFWKKMDWKSKKMYVCALVDMSKPIQSKIKNKELLSRRQLSYFYHLKHGQEKHAVCKAMFLATLGVTEAEVRYWLESYVSQTQKNLDRIYFENDCATVDESSLLNRENGPVSDQDNSQDGHKTGQSRGARRHKKKILKDFLSQLPKLPSKSSRHKYNRKIHLQTDIRSKLHLFEIYKEHCNKSNEEPLGKTYFAKAFDDMNLAISKSEKKSFN